MHSEQLAELKSNEVLRKRLAKLMAQHCFRNTKLEEFHGGIYPSSEAGDYSDVKVVSPFGEIPWTKVSRLSDEEMRALMIDVVNHCYQFVSQIFDDVVGEAIIETLKKDDLVPKWNDPERIS
jgi:hypothetical protein